MRKFFKQVLVVLLVLSMVIPSQGITAQAKTKASKYTISISKTVYTMKKGKTVTLTAKVNKAAKKKKIVWSSSNKKVATVNSKGKVLAKKNGKTTITAKIKGTKVSAKCNLVVGTPVTKVTLDKTSIELREGETEKLTAKVSPKKPTNKKIKFSSSNKSVAKVDKNGNITAVSCGTAIITAAAADGTGKKAKATVTVVGKDVTAVNIDADSVSIKVGETKQLTAVALPETAADKTITWSSDNAAASVSNTGLVTGVSKGTATITATAANGVKGTCSVIVLASGEVSTQSALEAALSDAAVKDIVYTSDSADKIVIPKGDYKDKTITIDAKNADVENSGSFKKVIIKAIAKNTYHEKGDNIIDFLADKGRVVVESQGHASINLQGNSGQDIALENKGSIGEVNISGKVTLSVSGSQSVPVILKESAADSKIVTSVELDITASAKWNMTILPGAENTKADVTSESCIPEVSGLGCVPVVVAGTVQVNVLAEPTDEYEITEKVAVSGLVRQYYIDAGEVKNSVSTEANVYLVRYTRANSGINASNYAGYISGVTPTATNSNGAYSMSNVPIGNYWIIIEKSGYATIVQNISITSMENEVFNNAECSLLSTEIAALQAVDEIRGTILDGYTGKSVAAAGIQVILRNGSGNIYGSSLQTVVTDASGNYKFTNVPAGVYTVEVVDLRQDLPTDVSHYNSNSKTIIVAFPYLPKTGYNVLINQKMKGMTGEGQVQFTLEWGKEIDGAERDVDSHLIGPKADGSGVFHVYFDDMEYSYNEDTYVDLDYDDTTWEGPEHTTIYKETKGVYRFYVHNYSKDTTLASSNVTVLVTIGDNQKVYSCPNQPGEVWYVCDYDSNTHTIKPVNKMINYTGSAKYVGLTEAERAGMYFDSEKTDLESDINSYYNYISDSEESAFKTTELATIRSWQTTLSGISNATELATFAETVTSRRKAVYDATPLPKVVTSADIFNVEYYSDEIEVYSLNGTEITIDFENSSLYSLTKRASTEYEGGKYQLTVTYNNGMVKKLPIYVYDAVKSEGINRVFRCNKLLAQYQDCDEITAVKAEVAGYATELSGSLTKTRFDQICTALMNIEYKYKYRIYVGQLTCSAVEDFCWFYSRYFKYDDNYELITSGIYGIELSGSQEDIAAAIADFSKWTVGFWDEEEEDVSTHNITYSFVDYAGPTIPDINVYKVLKVTDNTLGLTRNIPIFKGEE